MKKMFFFEKNLIIIKILKEFIDYNFNDKKYKTFIKVINYIKKKYLFI